MASGDQVRCPLSLVDCFLGFYGLPEKFRFKRFSDAYHRIFGACGAEWDQAVAYRVVAGRTALPESGGGGYACAVGSIACFFFLQRCGAIRSFPSTYRNGCVMFGIRPI